MRQQLAPRKDYTQVAWDERLIDDARQLIRLAVREDLDRFQDWTTTLLVDSSATGSATFVAKEPGVVCGTRMLELIADEMQTSIVVDNRFNDGDVVTANDQISRVSGPAREILTCERIMLNFAGRLSGVATTTQKYVQAIGGTQCQIYDTRKTTPGWRRLEKYAVSCGGGQNHRTGLFDGILIKDNHRMLSQQAADQSLADLVVQAREGAASALDSSITSTKLMIEIEVDTLDELRQVIVKHPDIVLLDNMSCSQMQQAVAIRDQLSPETELEASGGITIDDLKNVAATGVERISIGALTHSVRSLDIGLDWQ